MLDILDDCFHRYIVGQCTEALILGGLCTLGMLLLKLPSIALYSLIYALFGYLL